MLLVLSLLLLLLLQRNVTIEMTIIIRTTFWNNSCHWHAYKSNVIYRTEHNTRTATQKREREHGRPLLSTEHTLLVKKKKFDIPECASSILRSERAD